MDYAVNEAKAEHAQNILRRAPHVSARALNGEQFVNRACTLDLGQKVRVKNPSPGCLGGGLEWGSSCTECLLRTPFFNFETPERGSASEKQASGAFSLDPNLVLPQDKWGRR
jgi:hypothetical protein